MLRSAAFSPCRRYRYCLSRVWNPKLPSVMFVGLNPSTADEQEDDPTVRRCIGFARNWNFGGLILVNLFAYRSTDPADLLRVDDPVGPGNDKHILASAAGQGGLSWRGGLGEACSIATGTSCHFFQVPTASALPKRAIQSTLCTSPAILACDCLVRSLQLRNSASLLFWQRLIADGPSLRVADEDASLVRHHFPPHLVILRGSQSPIVAAPCHAPRTVPSSA